jgi:glutathione S-transferase
MSAAPSQPLVLSADKLSGRSHRARLMLSLLGLPYRVVEKSLARREHKQSDYLAIHPLGLLPALDDDGLALIDSLSILVYLTSESPRRGQGRSTRRCSGSDASTRWSTMPASSSPSPSPAIPRRTTATRSRPTSTASSF